METVSRDGVGFYEAYGKFIDPKPKPSFIESYVERRTERKARKPHKLNKWLENGIVALFAVVSLVVVFVLVVAQVAWLFIVLLAVFISAFAISSGFKSES